MTSTSSALSMVMRTPSLTQRRMWASLLGTPLTEMRLGSKPAASATANSPSE
jgi:hypothetical protein